METTGLSPYFHKITEVAAVKLRKGSIIDEFQTLVNPECRIPRFITGLSGISNEMVKTAPKIQKILPSFHDFLSDNPFVAHNAWFDHSFLNVASKRILDKGLDNDLLCTVKLSRQLLPDLPRRNLGALCSHLNIRNDQAHRALSDVKATSQVFSHFLNMLERRGINEYRDILEVQQGKLQPSKLIS